MYQPFRQDCRVRTGVAGEEFRRPRRSVDQGFKVPTHRILCPSPSTDKESHTYVFGCRRESVQDKQFVNVSDLSFPPLYLEWRDIFRTVS